MGIALCARTAVRMARCLMMFHLYVRTAVGMYMIPAVSMVMVSVAVMVVAAATLSSMIMMLVTAAAVFLMIMMPMAAATSVVVFIAKWQEIYPHDGSLLIYE